MSHPEFDEVPAYALDALDPDERVAFERHLADCQACRDAVAAYKELGASLAADVQGPPPSSDLSDRVLEEAWLHAWVERSRNSKEE